MALETGSEGIMNENEELDQIFKMHQNHASIVRMHEHVSINSPFQFTNASVGEVKSLLRDIDSSKDTGYDTIPPKWVKAAANEFAQPNSSLMNMSLSLSCFPHELKKNQRHILYANVRTILRLGIIDHYATWPACPKILNGSIMIKWVCIQRYIVYTIFCIS